MGGEILGVIIYCNYDYYRHYLEGFSKDGKSFSSRKERENKIG